MRRVCLPFIRSKSARCHSHPDFYNHRHGNHHARHRHGQRHATGHHSNHFSYTEHNPESHDLGHTVPAAVKHSNSYAFINADKNEHTYEHIHQYSNLHADIDADEYRHQYVDSNLHAHQLTHRHTDQYSHSIPNRVRWSMSDILPFLKSLISVSGLSGDETPAADLIKKQWTPLVDEISQSALASVHGLKRGTLKKSRRPSVMIATHMDAIGMMVVRIVDGFIYITNVGGIDARVLPGTPVTVHASGTKEELYGVIAMPPANLLPDGEGNGVVAMKYLFVDTGLAPGEVMRRVRVGDRVSFGTEPIELSGGTVSGHTLDNRASVAALTVCLEELRSKSHVWDVWAVASAQEEVNLGGAPTSAFQLRPTIAVVVDMTFGKGAGANGYQTFAIGKGVTLGISPVVHPFLYKRFKEVAERIEIPVSDDLMPEETSTDADTLQLTAEGIPTMVVSIPQRYMHTAVELIAVKDVQRAGRLLAEFIASLEADFMEKISWD